MAPLPPDLASSIAAVDAAMRRGDVRAAAPLATEAARLGAEHAPILVLAAIDQMDNDNLDEALGFATKARQIARHDAEVQNVYGSVLSRMGRLREAIAAYDAGLRIAPDKAALHYNKGCALDEMGYNNHARQSFERTIALQPENAGALGRLAYLAISRGDIAEARRYGDQALRITPDEQTALLALASADVEEKHFAAALHRCETLLSRTPAGINAAIALSLKGDALDGLQRPAEAFAAYTDHNAAMRLMARPAYEAPGTERALAQVRRLTAYFGATTADWRAAPQTAEPHPPVKAHVFLIGFPRSGTTLLEQVLASHPDVESMDERACLIDAEDAFLGPEGGLDKLATLNGPALAKWRKAYWKRVGEQGIRPGKAVFIDKLPLNAVCLPLVAKLFPAARILFARRDPVDVVWSSFRRRFGMNRQMYELTDLQGAATYYDAVMTLAEIYREKLGLAVCDTVYEKIVTDFETEVRTICAFLGIEWQNAMADFAAKSRQRAPNTPSGVQVARGLYRTAVGQWGSYSEQLAPVLPILQPWRSRFGYA